MVKFIEKTITSADIKFGLMVITGENKEIAKDFRDYLGGEPFTLKTDNNTFNDTVFIKDEKKTNQVRIACDKDFYKGREVGDVIYLRIIKNEKTIEVTDKKPDGIEQNKQEF
ncbi:MAG: hypothetical protein LBG80_12505 [Bacteroidales bacterium]|jgi:hypothetical protein|nr:hypothetical protein [Bacteroidales bacterium]